MAFALHYDFLNSPMVSSMFVPNHWLNCLNAGLKGATQVESCPGQDSENPLVPWQVLSNWTKTLLYGKQTHMLLLTESKTSVQGPLAFCLPVVLLINYARQRGGGHLVTNWTSCSCDVSSVLLPEIRFSATGPAWREQSLKSTVTGSFLRTDKYRPLHCLLDARPWDSH